MLLIVSFAAIVWIAVGLLVVALCVTAKQGDAAMAAQQVGVPAAPLSLVAADGRRLQEPRSSAGIVSNRIFASSASDQCSM